MKLVALLSGGIDSPVAAYVMAERGAEVVLLHMDNRPFSSEASLHKVMELAAVLRERTGQAMPLYAAPHGRNQRINMDACRHGFQCVLCKRLMLRTARGMAVRSGASAVVTGDSLGQVASQTLQNLRTEQGGLEFPVLRPLIGLDKLEIELLAKRIGTYEISIRSDGSPDCTALPSNPITAARPDDIVEEEKKIDIAEMVDFSVQNSILLIDQDSNCMPAPHRDHRSYQQ